VYVQVFYICVTTTSVPERRHINLQRGISPITFGKIILL